MTRAVMIDQNYLHIDGYRNIISFDDQCIRLDCKTKILEIQGEKLLIDSFTGIEMTISGKVDNICWMNKTKETVPKSEKKKKE